MKMRTLQLAALVASVALGTSATEPAFAWGELTMRHTIETQTTFARRTATEAERRYAGQKGKAIYNDLSPEKKAQLKKDKVRFIAVALAPKAKTPSKLPVEKKPSDNPPAPKPAKEASVGDVDLMIYDTLGGETVNKYVYTVNSAPSIGTSMKLDDYDTLYVGR
jgi:hypothetical protein